MRYGAPLRPASRVAFARSSRSGPLRVLPSNWLPWSSGSLSYRVSEPRPSPRSPQDAITDFAGEDGGGRAGRAPQGGCRGVMWCQSGTAAGNWRAGNCSHDGCDDLAGAARNRSSGKCCIRSPGVSGNLRKANTTAPWRQGFTGPALPRVCRTTALVARSPVRAWRARFPTDRHPP